MEQRGFVNTSKEKSTVNPDVLNESEEHQHSCDEESEGHPLEVVEFVRIGIVLLAIFSNWLHLFKLYHGIDIVGLLATLIGGYPIFREAFEALLERRMTMELSMTIALSTALAIGDVFTALVIALFVLVAHHLFG